MYCELAAELHQPVTVLTGVTLAHCEVGSAVEEPYCELHTLPVTSVEGITIYSGAWGKDYAPTEQKCARSITAGLLNTIDVPNLIEAAYRDGVRVFIEVGPGNSFVRSIDSILAGRPHIARAAHVSKQDAVSQILRLVGHLAAERCRLISRRCIGRETRCVGHREPAARARQGGGDSSGPAGRMHLRGRPVHRASTVRLSTPQAARTSRSSRPPSRSNRSRRERASAQHAGSGSIPPHQRSIHANGREPRAVPDAVARGQFMAWRFASRPAR